MRANATCTFILVALFGLLMGLPPAALAAEAIDHLNVQEPTRPEYLPAKPAEGFQLPPVSPEPRIPAPGAAGESVWIHTILFRGNRVIPTSELDAVAAAYAGRSLDAAGLEDLRQKLSRHYVDRGYINSGALLGKEAIDGDTVTFDIIEGRLSEVRLHGLERLNENYLRQRLTRSSDGALNVDTLRERFQLLLDDPLFERLNARLIPDARLGEAILDVEVLRARPYQLTAFANNYRPPSIGSNAYGLSGWVRNLTGQGDVLNGSVQDSTQGGANGRYSVGWQMPLNQTGTRFSFQFEHEDSTVIEDPLQDLDIKSVLDTRDFGLSQVFVETLQHKLTLGVNRVERKNSTTLLGQRFSFIPGEPDGVTRVSAWRFWQEYAYRSESQVLALRSTFTLARNNAQEIAGLPAGTPQPDSHYNIWLGQAQYARRVLENGAQLILIGNLQQTRDRLLPLDRMSIGGVYTVRGYRENQMIRDTGSIVNVEFDYPLVRNPGKGFNLSLVPFYDYGRGKNQSEAADTLTSMGLLTRMRWEGVSLDFSFAKRLSYPNFVRSNGGNLQDKGINFQLNYNFF